MDTLKHYEESAFISASPQDIFVFADDPMHFSAHMNESSMMMGGGKMETLVDEGQGKKLGSHIIMKGKAFGISLYLDEVITIHEPPYKKAWKTVGEVKLLVIGDYTLGFEITPQQNGSNFKVFIDYAMPKKNVWMGKLFGKMYAKWCVRQMVQGTVNHFTI